jgi:hypothetical protein
VLVLTIDNPGVARRARWLVTILTGGDCTVDDHLLHDQTGQLLITGAVRRLSMRLGLLDGRGRTVRGLPPAVVADPAVEVAAAVWRAALLHGARFVTRHPIGALEIWCPDAAVALALIGAARRLGVQARTRPPSLPRTRTAPAATLTSEGQSDLAATPHTDSRPSDSRPGDWHGATTGTTAGMRGERVVITDSKGVAALLAAAGAPRGATSWTATSAAERTASRQRTEPHAAGTAAATLAGHNQQRAWHAAQHNIDAARRALTLFADTLPAELADAARLRLAHPTASLSELAELANPPTTKDTIAGRLRRLTRRLPSTTADQ